MTDHAFKGRGQLTLGATTIEVATEISLRVERDVVPIAYWAATGSTPGGIKEVAQRVRGVAVDLVLHDYAPSVLAVFTGSTTGAGATGYRKVKLGMGSTTGTVALAFSGYNKLGGATGNEWNFSLPKFRTEIVEELPVVGSTIAAYRVRGHSLRDPTATGAEYGYLAIATG